MSDKKDTMAIWSQVCETDPAITKQVNQRGGFTAICAQSQVKRATEVFGAFGEGWAVSSENIQVYPEDGIATYEGVLHWGGRKQGEGYSGWKNSFGICSSICYKKNGKVDGDFVKKMATDALTKGLSRLGFNSDVFEGKFDDNKYVAEMQEKFSEPREPTLNEKKLAFLESMIAQGIDKQKVKDEIAAAGLATCGKQIVATEEEWAKVVAHIENSK